MTEDLPPSWVERLRLLVVASEAPVVLFECRAGDGGERLLNRWCGQGVGVPLRPGDLREDQGFRRATERAREIRSSAGRNAAVDVPVWFVVRSMNPFDVKFLALSDWLLPGERLIVVSEASSAPADGLLVVPRSQFGLSESEATELFLLRKTEVPDQATLERLLEKSGGDLLALEGIIAESHDLESLTVKPAVSLEPRILEIELLGWPRLTERREDGRAGVESRALDWGYQSVLELLAALATSPERQLGRDDLLRRLWPDLEFLEARKQLYPAVSHLRKLLQGFGPGRAVEFSKGVYRLSESWAWRVDVDGLELAIERTQSVHDDLLEAIAQVSEGDGKPANLAHDVVEQLEAGWRLVRGDFLQGFENDWVRGKRSQLRLAHQLILRRLACVLAGSGQSKRVEEVVRSLLIQDRVQEDAHLAMMRLYAGRGRIDLARRQYEKMCAALHEEVGMQPMDNTIREVERILASPLG